MKITDLKCTVLGNHPVIRITTDEGIHGLGQVEGSKHYLKPHILFYKPYIIDEDPTDVERVIELCDRWHGMAEKDLPKPMPGGTSTSEMATLRKVANTSPSAA